MGSQENTQRLSFFITISDEDLTHKLIPTDLIKQFNGEMPVEFILNTSSCGRCWLVKLKRVEENLFFQEGWSDFFKDNYLESGNFLVLEYIGNSKFYVKIYGKNGLEKKLRSPGDDVEKPIDPEIKRKEELKSKGKLTKDHTEFDYKCRAEAKFGRDSVGFDKNKNTRGSCTCIQPTWRRMEAKTERTGVHEAGSSVKAERPYFILTWTQKNDSQMEIPGKFLREVGGRLPVGVFLKCQSGIKWPIELRKADGRVWFEDGWKQFIEYHCMSDHQLLIFRYDCNLQFDVSIFNITSNSTCEMKDMDDFRHHEAPNLDKRHELNEESRNKSAWGTKSRCKNKRSTGSMSSLEERPDSGYKKKRSSGLNDENRNKLAFETKSRCKNKRSTESLSSSEETTESRYEKKRSSGDRGKMSEGSNSDESSKTQKQSEESSPYGGNETSPRSSTHNEDKEESFASVRQEEMEKKDYVECFDVDDSSGSFEVSAVAKKQAVNVKNKNTKASATQLASEFKSKKPFFTINILSSYVNHHYLPIPSKFGKTHLPEDLVGRMIRLEVSDGETWLVKCIVSGSVRDDTRLSKGVTDFLSSNNLGKGDICVFEVVKLNPDIVFKVHIFRHENTD